MYLYALVFELAFAGGLNGLQSITDLFNVLVDLVKSVNREIKLVTLSKFGKLLIETKLRNDKFDFDHFRFSASY